MFADQLDQSSSYAPAAPKQADGGAQPHVTDKGYVDNQTQDEGWLPAVDVPQEPQSQQGVDFQIGNSSQQGGLNPPQRGISTRSTSSIRHKGRNLRSPSPMQGTSGQGASDVRRSASRRSMFTGSTGQPIEGSTFIGGAATTGPHSTAQPHQDLTTRAAAADANLSRKDRSRIAKSEAEDGKRLSKIIKDEGRAEKQSLGLAINELSMLQQEQANAISNEARAHQQRAKLQAEYQKQEKIFLVARAKYDAAHARLNSEEEALDLVRNKARDATEKLQDKSQEVDSLRTMFAVDERERAAKLVAISEKPQRPGSSGCVIA
ncbi:hypothetical protein C0991_010646 [Blastosporella zonata]|nr:hypothetical protein C0991_010646 [Blastosporella zonata]